MAKGLRLWVRLSIIVGMAAIVGFVLAMDLTPAEGRLRDIKTTVADNVETVGIEIDVQEASASSSGVTVPPDLAAARERIFTTDWRPELSAELVVCLGGEYPIQAYASAGPLQVPLSAARFVEACEGTDFDLQYRTPQVCYESEAKQITVTDTACLESESRRPLDTEVLDRLNELRLAEVEMFAVPSSRVFDAVDVGEIACPSSDEAMAWATIVLEARSLAGIELSALDEGDACYQPIAYWPESAIVVQPYGFQDSGTGQ